MPRNGAVREASHEVARWIRAHLGDPAVHKINETPEEFAATVAQGCRSQQAKEG